MNNKSPSDSQIKQPLSEAQLLAQCVVRELNTVVSVCSLTLIFFFCSKDPAAFPQMDFFDPLSKKKKCKEKEGPAVQVDSRGILACVAKGDHRTNRGKVRSSRQSGAKIYLPPDFHRQAGGKERAKEHTVAYFHVLDVGSALQAFTRPLSGYELL